MDELADVVCIEAQHAVAAVAANLLDRTLRNLRRSSCRSLDQQRKSARCSVLDQPPLAQVWNRNRQIRRQDSVEE